jgi:putative ABC transport system permease protein
MRLTWTMLALNSTEIALGRGFTPADDEHATHNVIVGYDIVDNLLGEGDPIGKEIRVDGISVHDCGRRRRQGKMLGQSRTTGWLCRSPPIQQTYGYNDSCHLRPRQRQCGGDGAGQG